MCGRYRLSRRKKIVEQYFDTVWDEPEWTPRYNIAPTQPVPVIRQNPTQPEREMSLMRWGLIPSWAKGVSGSPMINARSETAVMAPAFRDAMKSRRCLIPADGFYEWQKATAAGAKQPFCFEVSEGELFAFAGLWDRWKDQSGKWIKSCSILTTTPNSVISPVHERMPVILHREDYDLWLDPGMTKFEAICDLFKPFDPLAMRCYPVSARLNHVINDDEGCSTPVQLDRIQTQTTLF